MKKDKLKGNKAEQPAKEETLLIHPKKRLNSKPFLRFGNGNQSRFLMF
ncbi:hypothetical protein [Croceibacter atlanticus]|jgi:hypothetical protein|uniref:Uncharacterized protein n=1 Tax=Croceibacter atlanticus (strain ATCC BAA-628 / JCM 21780 / CIP 108009 / IAM 15332 / KCTC 12090 / HTCC2559) TaxID=216432 RepID=A3U993_CROAH|nr:hypothetical protein [Croceibacter atlanticus]EAP86379.1 hypothetical protein CA2559_10103 [Croceibacter atlanticus HTCC2559]MBW4971144.1 hypothetical protein [Croceibacter atlanticus]WSP34060.1 hypothetical protein VVL01_11665 [Croceibacter atlanticus]|tara:strand:+ start:37411 stop:37554 length:144 start_codon:yes stop_codon:yes gene_type:complete